MAVFLVAVAVAAAFAVEVAQVEVAQVADRRVGRLTQILRAPHRLVLAGARLCPQCCRFS